MTSGFKDRKKAPLFSVISYPGAVNNIENAVKNLGGRQKLRKVFAFFVLEIFFLVLLKATSFPSFVLCCLILFRFVWGNLLMLLRLILFLILIVLYLAKLYVCLNIDLMGLAGVSLSVLFSRGFAILVLKISKFCVLSWARAMEIQAVLRWNWGTDRRIRTIVRWLPKRRRATSILDVCSPLLDSGSKSHAKMQMKTIVGKRGNQLNVPLQFLNWTASLLDWLVFMLQKNGSLRFYHRCVLVGWILAGGKIFFTI